ncbi:MAG: HAD hydrolase family protein [Desulfobulbaceae bacterium]|nr:HAD hydrolase family protein [Desulfobulbaceae bacterium]
MSNNNPCSPAGNGGYPSDCDITAALLAKANERLSAVKRPEGWQQALQRGRNISLLLLDVDGVLTDGSITYTQGGGESKSFNTQDGFGLRILQEAGIEVGLITARVSEAVDRRARDLNLTHVYQGNSNKIEAFNEILASTKISPDRIAYMGDDWLDMVLIDRVGFSLAPANAVAEVKRRVHWVTEKRGGYGAVREACDLLIEAVGKREFLIGKYFR